MGPLKGDGGKYLPLPQRHVVVTPERCSTFKRPTWNVFVLWRAFGDKDSGDAGEAVALRGATPIHPLAWGESAGADLLGGSTYGLRIPGPVSAASAWDIALYGAANASGPKNRLPLPSLGSLDGLEYDEDGSVDLDLGPQLPDGVPEASGRRTAPGNGRLVLTLPRTAD